MEDIAYLCHSLDAMKEYVLPSGDVPLVRFLKVLVNFGVCQIVLAVWFYVLVCGIYFQVTGVVYLSARAAERFLSFHVLPPLDSCTYLGLDSGTKAIQVRSIHLAKLPAKSQYLCTPVKQSSLTLPDFHFCKPNRC